MFMLPVAGCAEWHTLPDREAACLELRDLVGIVGDQSKLLNAKLLQHTACRHEIALIHLKAERMVGINSVETIILKRIGPHLVEKADISPFCAR